MYFIRQYLKWLYKTSLIAFLIMHSFFVQPDNQLFEHNYGIPFPNIAPKWNQRSKLYHLYLKKIIIWKLCSYLQTTLISSFLCPRIEWSGAYCFCPVCLFVCLSVCLSVVNFNLCYNFWTVRDRDFIFGMHAPLMMLFQMTPRPMLKIAFWTLFSPGA